MASNTNVVLQATVTVFGFEANLEMPVYGAPVSIRLSPERPVNFQDVWNGLSHAIEEIAGFGLPDLGAWKGLIRAPSLIAPSLWLGPSGSDSSKLSVYLQLDFLDPIGIGGSIDLGGGVTVSITPNFEVWAIYIGYDAAAGGLSLRAKVSTPTTSGTTSPGGPKTQIVSYPFPVPPQSSVGTFQMHYLGIGQRVGPTVQVTANDPMAAIFDQLESELAADDPATVLTRLAHDFYQPDRDWFIAADLEMKGFRIRLLFNDPTMYGLEITVAANSPTPFAGLLFEILYQKLSPNLGMYYGALTLPTLMRQIPMEGFILILPGFQIWIYTNGDFRVNVGWPIGGNSIGISFEVLVGLAGFYFAKLRSADNPGAQPSVNYDPIIAFGIGVGLSAQRSFNASIFSASIAVSLTATFQGLLAWRAGNQVYAPPDHYWFAATAGISVMVQGTVDFSIIKASVLIAFTANAGVAFETGYKTFITISAYVRVEVSVKIVFFTIHLSFHTTIGTQFSIGSGAANASINGPLAPGLAIAGGYGGVSAPRAQALAAAARMLAGLRAARPQPVRFAAEAAAGPWASLEAAGRAAAAAPVSIDLSFLLQPTVVYAPDGTFSMIASLVTDCPAPGSPPSPSSTSFERLIGAMVNWLLGMAPPGTLSDQFQFIVDALGQGSDPPLGNWSVFAGQLQYFLRHACVFQISGIDGSAAGADQVAAVVPMLDALQMTYVDIHGTTHVIDFDSYNMAPENYPLAVQLYFEDMAASGSTGDHDVRRVAASSASPGGPSVASLLQLDYFLMQARNAAGALLTAARAYEGAAQEEFLQRIDAAHEGGPPDPWEIVDHVSRYVAVVTGDDELRTLLEEFDYSSAAGMGSRFLLGGLQLPIPADVPSDPTHENMAAVPTAPLFTLTGQQFAAAAGAEAQAELAVNPASGAPEGWITFAGSPGTSATASLPLPAEPPPIPSPAWSGDTSPTGPGEGSIEVQWVAPLTPQPLYVALKSQIGWNRSGVAQTVLPLPEDLQALAAQASGLRLQIAPEAPPDSNTPVPAPSPVTPIDAAALLYIRISVSQVPASALANVTQAGSPVTGSPSAGAATQYLPNVYQLAGTDEATRDLVHQALLGDLTHAAISLLHPQAVGGSPTGSPLSTATIMRSDVLDPDVLIAKTNLSTLNQIPQVSAVQAVRAAMTAPAETDIARITDVAGFLRLVWELSVVNAPGYFLFYATEDGSGLPPSLFSGTGVTGAQSAELDIVVELGPAPSPQVSVPAFANAVSLDEGDVDAALYAQVFDGQGASVPAYSPSYPAGSLALAFTWDHLSSSPNAPVPVEDLYHLLQYSVEAIGPYAGSVWSLPIGPTEENGPVSTRRELGESVWQYLQAVPASSFLAGEAPNRYEIIGQPIAVQLRIIDVYGDALPDVHTTSETPLYQDRLVGLAEWPGLFVSYRVLPAAGNQATLAIGMTFDPDAVVPPGGSPNKGIDPSQARPAWTSTLARYQLVIDQLTDPNTSIAVSTTLVDGPAGDPGANAAAIVAFARAIAESIEEALETTPSPDPPFVLPPPPATLNIPLPFASVAALSATIFPVRVSVAFTRARDLVVPEALRVLPAVAAVSYDVPADLTGGSVSPGGSGSVVSFAAPFEQALANFDGRGGCLKLAQRAGVTAGQPSASPALWALCWSQSAGISVTLGDDLVFFALKPLSKKPINRQVGGNTWSGVDLDAWARDFLAAFDAFLSPELATAIGILDIRNRTSYYGQLMQTKQRLAKAIPLGVAPLFVEQYGIGDLDAAQKRLEQSLLTALASAFTVSTIIQIPAEVTAIGSPATISPDVAPRFFGAIGAPDGGSGRAARSPGAAAPYTLSGGNLDVVAGDSWMTTLLTLTPDSNTGEAGGAQAQFVLPLAYMVSYLQHDFEPGEAYLGYVPSSWLKFALPDAAPLQMPIAPAATLPAPLIFQPDAPVLVQQAAVGAPMVSPTGPEPAEQEIAEALRWLYLVDMTLALKHQDSLYLDVTYNRADVSVSNRVGRSEDEPHTALFDALAGFRAWYAAAAPQFGTIPAAAFPSPRPAGGMSSPLTAEELVAGFQRCAEAVADGWEQLHGAFLGGPLPPVEVITDRFYLTLDSQTPTVHLFGLVTDAGAPKHWPSIRTADGQYWAPQPPSPPVASPGDWVETSYTFGAALDLSAVTLGFGPLDSMERQSATMSAWVVRNANLLPDMTTNPAFIYTTQTVSFSNSIIPLIHRKSVPPVTPAATLVETLAQILSPIEQPSALLSTRLRLSASYTYAVGAPMAGEPLLASDAITLMDNADPVSSPPVAGRSARAIAGWYARTGPSDAGSALHLSVTLFGTLGGQQLPIIQIDDIPIPVAGLSLEWWEGGLMVEPRS